MRVGGGILALVIALAAASPAGSMTVAAAGAMRPDYGLIQPARWRHWRRHHWRRYYWRRYVGPQRPPLANLDSDPEPGVYRAHEWVDPPSGAEPSAHD